jgi:carboxylesterase type B
MGYAEAWGKTATEYTYVEAYKRIAGMLVQMGRKCWLYRWDYTGGLRANHSSDNEALFSRTNKEKVDYNPEVTAKVDRCFQNYILNFVEFGTPSVNDENEWMPCTPERMERLLIDEVCTKEKVSLEYDEQFPLQVFRLEHVEI